MNCLNTEERGETSKMTRSIDYTQKEGPKEVPRRKGTTKEVQSKLTEKIDTRVMRYELNNLF